MTRQGECRNGQSRFPCGVTRQSAEQHRPRVVPDRAGSLAICCMRRRLPEAVLIVVHGCGAGSRITRFVPGSVCQRWPAIRPGVELWISGLLRDWPVTRGGSAAMRLGSRLRWLIGRTSLHPHRSLGPSLAKPSGPEPVRPDLRRGAPSAALPLGGSLACGPLAWHRARRPQAQWDRGDRRSGA